MPTKKLLRAGLAVLLILILLFLSLKLFLVYYLQDKIAADIADKVTKATEGGYTLLLKKVDIRLIGRTIRLEELVLAPSDKQMERKGPQFIFRSDALEMQGFSFIKFLQTDGLEMESLLSSNSRISVYQPVKEPSGGNSDSLLRNFSLQGLVPSSLPAFSAREIRIKNAAINVYRIGKDTVPVISSDSIDINIDEVIMDQANRSSGKFLPGTRIGLLMKGFTYHLNDGLYSVHGKQLSISWQDSLMTIDSLVIDPLFPEKSFGKAAGKQVSRANITTSRLEFHGMDLDLFAESGGLMARRLTIQNALVNVYRDNNDALAKISRPSVQKILRELPFYLAIDTAKINNANVIYDEIPEGSIFAGRIFFHNMNVTVTGIHNDTSLIRKKESIEAFAESRFMNAASMRIYYRFPLNTTEERFYCKGKIGKMDLTALNPLTRKSQAILIREGTLDSLEFEFNARDKESEGTMRLLYHGLKIEFVDKEHPDSEERKRLKGLFFRWLFVRQDNPAPNEPVRIARIRTEKNPYRYFFFYTLSSVASGIAPTLVGEQKAELLKNIKKAE